MALPKKISLKDIAKVSVKLKEKAEALKPKESIAHHGKVVNFYVEYADGTALLAQGEHADLIYRYTNEAQMLCTMHAFSAYVGPGMASFSKEEALKLITGGEDDK